MYTVHVDSWNTNKSLTCIQFLLHWCSKFAFLLNIFWNDHSCNSPELLYNSIRRKYTLILPLTEVSFSFLHRPPSSSKGEKAPDTWGILLNMTGLWCAIKTKQKKSNKLVDKEHKFKAIEKPHLYATECYDCNSSSVYSCFQERLLEKGQNYTNKLVGHLGFGDQWILISQINKFIVFLEGTVTNPAT